jgi:hypothetical protein
MSKSKNLKSQKLAALDQWIEIMVRDGGGQFGASERRFVETYRMTIQACIETMTLKQIQATLSLLVCANGLGHAQYRNQARVNGWAPRETPCDVLKLVRS